MGDDLMDLPVLARAGLVGGAGGRRRGSSRAACTGSARHGAAAAPAREIIEMVLRAQTGGTDRACRIMPP